MAGNDVVRTVGQAFQDLGALQHSLARVGEPWIPCPPIDRRGRAGEHDKVVQSLVVRLMFADDR